MRKKPKVLDRRLVAQSQVFRVEQVDLEFTNGSRRRFERLLGGESGSVLVVPLLDTDTVLLIREYAAGTHSYELAFPKGIIEQGEDLLSAANREIKEEVGYGAKRLEHLKSMSIAPGYIQHQSHVVLARDLHPEKLEGDEPEVIEVVPWKLRDLDMLFARSDFSEARSIAALCLARRRLKQEGLLS